MVCRGMNQLAEGIKAVRYSMRVTSCGYSSKEDWHFGDLYIKIITCLNELCIHRLLLYIFIIDVSFYNYTNIVKNMSIFYIAGWRCFQAFEIQNATKL